MGKKSVFSESEYTSIRAEMIERIRLINSQSFTALAAVISFWAAGFTFKMALISNSTYFAELYEKIIMEFLSAVIFLMPIFLFVPLSVKSGENLTQIASLSAYIRVFYDYPVHKGKKNKNWETSNNLLSNANVDKKGKSKIFKLYNGDYTILASISLVIYMILEALNIKTLLLLFKDAKINSLFFHCIVIAYLFISIVCIIVVIIIHKVASMGSSLMKGTIYYVQGYIKRARELGIIKEKDLQKAIAELNPKRDLIVEDYYK